MKTRIQQATKDHLIFELIKDENYQITRDGKVLTLITKTGKKSKDGTWREAGFDIKDSRTTYRKHSLPKTRMSKVEGTTLRQVPKLHRLQVLGSP